MTTRRPGTRSPTSSSRPAPDFVGEGGCTGSFERVEELWERPRGTAVGCRLSRQFVDHGAGCVIEQVEEEGVRIDDVDLVVLDAVIGEVGGVERDDRPRVCPNGGSKDVAVFGSQVCPSMSTRWPVTSASGNAVAISTSKRSTASESTTSIRFRCSSSMMSADHRAR